MAQTGMAGRCVMNQRMIRNAKVRRAVRINRAMLKITVGLIVACMFVYIGRMAEITAAAKEIHQLEVEIDRLDEKRQGLDVQLEENQGIQRIKDGAARLGMADPQEGHVYMISLNGYATYNNTQTAHDSVNP